MIQPPVVLLFDPIVSIHSGQAKANYFKIAVKNTQ